MRKTFVYDSYRYEYQLEFTDRKTLGLIVRPNLQIVARVPCGTTPDEIELFLRRKWRWLEKQLQELKKLHKIQREKQYVSGEAFYYLGKQYTLQVTSGKHDYVRLGRGQLQISTTKKLRDGVHNSMLLNEWYAIRRDKIFKEEFLRALKKFDYTVVPQLRQRAMTHRWGSHTADNKIVLNPRLIEAPKEAIYYVCIHELCHRTNRKHDKKFHEELDKRLPEWREIKERLEIKFG